MTAPYRLPAAALLAALVAAWPAAAQNRQACDNGRGVRVADLGFSTLEARRMSFRWENGRGVAEFGSEPTIRGVRGDGPASGRLRDGDVIVAVDGQLITTREGGRRYGGIDPGERVRLSIRRGGRTQDVTVVAGERCMRTPTPPTPPTPPRVDASPVPHGLRPPPSPAPPAPRQPRGAAPRAPAAPPAPPAPAAPPAPPAPPEIMPNGWFGFGIQCNNCDVQTRRGRRGVFRFREQPTVVSVEPGTPAARAGMRRGDRLTHVDGVSLTTPDGWRRFAAIDPGEEVRWTYTRGNRSRTAAMTALTRPDARRAPPPAAATTQRLRYSGVVGGSQVEVRGAPVTVSTDPRTGETIIRSADLTVRIQPQRR